jgi:hypothetical protein
VTKKTTAWWRGEGRRGRGRESRRVRKGELAITADEDGGGDLRELQRWVREGLGGTAGGPVASGEERREGFFGPIQFLRLLQDQLYAAKDCKSKYQDVKMHSLKRDVSTTILSMYKV